MNFSLLTLFKNKLALVLPAVAFLSIFVWVVATQGPLAPVKVTVVNMASGSMSTSIFGIGTVEARRSYALGPTSPGRVAEVQVDVGDSVRAGQLLARMDTVDLDDRLISAELATERAEYTIRAAEASLIESKSRLALAKADLVRYEEMRSKAYVSEQTLLTKRYEVEAANAAVGAAVATLESARRDRQRIQSDAVGIRKLREQLRLLSPVDGIVTARHTEPGTTVVAGQAVIEMIDPTSLWVSARIDQRQAGEVRVGQRAAVVMRSAPDVVKAARVERIDWISDPVTEERSVQIVFTPMINNVPLGELVEVTIWTQEINDTHWIPTAARRREGQQDGVWVLSDEGVHFRVVRFGVSTLDGRTQVLAGLSPNEQIIVHTQKPLSIDTDIRVVPSLVDPGR
ncbi:MAG: efflux RND transporter periplasmic adaptor subunit [Gammaproteobacteria bacterium]|nr:efflux RND transporter periplasmic adaptor subunit [Gammaproteobacteria bacterium]